MLEKVKNALRVKSNAFDDEILGIIAAAQADLRLVGVAVPSEGQAAEGATPTADDPLLTRAIILYAKANFGYSDESEKYQKAYDHLKCSLSLAGDYIAVE